MDRSPIRFATFLAPNMLPVYQFVADFVGDRLGLPTRLQVGTAFDQFEKGEAEVGFICGLPYVELTRRPDPPVELLAVPILQGPRYQGLPIYYSDVIVRRDSTWQSFADLRGCTWAFNDPDSHSGYNITRYRLVQLGETRGFFGRVVEAGFHQEAIRMVAMGQVDASAIDSQVLAVELRDHPELAEQVRVIEALGPATIQPVVAASQLPRGLKAALRDTLLDLHRDPGGQRALAHGFIERFVPVADSTYDDIRQMVAAAEAVGFMTLR